MTNQQLVTKGVEAQQVLDNVAYQDAMKRLREDVHASWLECPVRDREGQLLLLQVAKLAGRFEAILNGMVSNGSFAFRQIEIDEARSESKAKRLMRKVF